MQRRGGRQTDLAQLKGKGVDAVYVIAANDPFVMSAWNVMEHAQDKIVFANDTNLQFSKGVRDGVWQAGRATNLAAERHAGPALQGHG